MSFDALGNPTGTVYPLIGATQPLALTATLGGDTLKNATGTIYDGAVAAGHLLEDNGTGAVVQSTNTDTQIAAAVAATGSISSTTMGDLAKFSNTTGTLADSGVPTANFPVSGTVSGDIVKFNGTTGQLADSTYPLSNLPSSGTVSGDLVKFSNTTGAHADCGAAQGTVGALNIAGAGAGVAPLILPAQASAPTGTHQVGEMYVNTAGIWFSCVVGGASPIWSPEYMPNVTNGMSMLLPGGYSYMVCNTFEITSGDVNEIGSGAYMEIQ